MTIELVLGDITAVANRSGQRKVNKMVEIKNRDVYQPMIDFYKRLRDGIVRTHKKNLAKKELLSILQKIANPTKLKNFPAVIEAYQMWWGEKQLTWFEPPRIVHMYKDVEVTINPELGLIIDGQPYVIKLYFKKTEHITPQAAAVVTGLMETALKDVSPPNTIMGILDIRNNKLFTSSALNPEVTKAIDTELGFISSIWDKV